MNEKLTISNRLKQIASYLPKKANFADIGSDHAYLPVYVCLNDSEATSIAGEINKGPYDSANEQVTKWNLQDRIMVRQGDGLSVLNPNEVNQVVIAGMGGTLITSILETGKDRLGSVKQLILQPNINARYIRKWLYANDFYLTEECILDEDGYYYEILVAEKFPGNLKQLSEKEFYLGPIILLEKNKAFYDKWTNDLNKKVKILKQMESSSHPNTEKINQFKQEIKWLREELI